MEKLRIKTKKDYYVIIEENILMNAWQYLPKDAKKAVIIWDENVSVKPISKLGTTLESHGIETIALSVEGGENFKSLKTYEKMMKYLVEANIGRNDVIFAVGGGSVGDMVGFIASTFKRGLKLVQIPTTLLAACDSSIGGKTAINFEGEKNVLGTFYQPDLVLIDPVMFDTLSEKQFKEGCSEIIKYGMISDYELLELLSKKPVNKDRKDYAYISSILFRVIGIKAKVVEEDEYDFGPRNILNFGHTFGHAIEAESEFKISHGDAVAMGMRIITKMAVKKGIADPKTLELLEKSLLSHNIDAKCPFKLNTLLSHIKKDKKVKGSGIRIVLPKIPGKCYIEDIEINELIRLFNE